MATGPDLRIGDAEREAAATELREHYAQGRLTLEEFNQRLETVFKAATRRDLNSVTSDLPHATAPSAPLPVASASGYDRSGHGSAWGSGRRARLGMFPLIIAAFATWLMLFELHLRMFPWPGKLAIFLAIFGVIRGLMRRVFGLGRGGSCGPRRVKVRRRF
jgi:Domain of unknown function (DUF1707)